MINNTFIIAEAGVNHNGDINTALKLVDIASDSGADAVKFQTFNTNKLTTKRARLSDYQNYNNNTDLSQQDLLRSLELSARDYIKLSEYCNSKNIEFMSTAFDVNSLDFLIKETNLKRIKIPSGENINPFLLLRAARSNLPIIVSTGLSELNEIKSCLSILAYGFINKYKIPTTKEALNAYRSPKSRKSLLEKVTILQCVSDYPALPEDMNIKAMVNLGNIYNLSYGLSDHSIGIEISIAAVALGATVIEKHFTLDKNMKGPDHKASLSPLELTNMVRSIRVVEKSLGNGEKKPSRNELKNLNSIRGSLVAKKNIKKNTEFSKNNITVKRPGDGLSPLKFLDLNGTKSKKNFKLDEQIIINE